MAFRTTGTTRWRFAWAFLLGTDDADSLTPVSSPRLLRTDPRPFVTAVEGTYLEASSGAQLERMGLWAQLLGDYVRQITHVAASPDPLWRLWAEVDASPAADCEQQVNGVERMMYMSSQSNNDGSYTLDVTFEIGTDINMAQVLVQMQIACDQNRGRVISLFPLRRHWGDISTGV